MPEITEVMLERGMSPWFDDRARCGVLTFNTSPPRLVLAVVSPAGEESTHELFLGDTFPVGENTWRFDDAVITNTDIWTVTLRYVAPGSPPFRPPAEPRDYVMVEFRSFGTIDEAGIGQVEQDLGRRLPRSFRMWLAHNNGAAPVEEIWIPGTHVSLDPFTPVLGVHPENPIYDLRNGERQVGRWFTKDYVVIAIGVEGYFAVGVSPQVADQIFVMRSGDALQLGNQYLARGYGSPAEYLCAERLFPVGSSIGTFLANLRPTPPSPPATLRPM
ncbi:DUF6406 domain-containing protein [Dactylosporangium siamense]|uniref:Knr4/Smi1-like domain-containing protein n=1 Tax=Dactylosporangium siamense TaxID=685454 RepID=A0A919U8K4_9ACTN|nr:DUF6406 domain-containing protein [Dactylosporangium siamense]GIG46659.1 hypothetical protein Dsi01nite_047000 [Dactylosporangium siamense]